MYKNASVNHGIVTSSHRCLQEIFYVWYLHSNRELDNSLYSWETVNFHQCLVYAQGLIAGLTRPGWAGYESFLKTLCWARVGQSMVLSGPGQKNKPVQCSKQCSLGVWSNTQFLPDFCLHCDKWKPFIFNISLQIARNMRGLVRWASQMIATFLSGEKLIGKL